MYWKVPLAPGLARSSRCTRCFGALAAARAACPRRERCPTRSAAPPKTEIGTSLSAARQAGRQAATSDRTCPSSWPETSRRVSADIPQQKALCTARVHGPTKLDRRMPLGGAKRHWPADGERSMEARKARKAPAYTGGGKDGRAAGWCLCVRARARVCACVCTGARVRASACEAACARACAVVGGLVGGQVGAGEGGGGVAGRGGSEGKTERGRGDSDQPDSLESVAKSLKVARHQSCSAKSTRALSPNRIVHES